MNLTRSWFFNPLKGLGDRLLSFLILDTGYSILDNEVLIFRIQYPESSIQDPALFEDTHIPHPLTQNFRFIVNQGDDT